MCFRRIFICYDCFVVKFYVYNFSDFCTPSSRWTRCTWLAFSIETVGNSVCIASVWYALIHDFFMAKIDDLPQNKPLDSLFYGSWNLSFKLLNSNLETQIQKLQPRKSNPENQTQKLKPRITNKTPDTFSILLFLIFNSGFYPTNFSWRSRFWTAEHVVNAMLPLLYQYLLSISSQKNTETTNVLNTSHFSRSVARHKTLALFSACYCFALFCPSFLLTAHYEQTEHSHT